MSSSSGLPARESPGPGPSDNADPIPEFWGSELVIMTGRKVWFDASWTPGPAEGSDCRYLLVTVRSDSSREIVARGGSYLIHRSRFPRHKFWEVCNTQRAQKSKHVSEFGFDLFDKFGQLNRVYIDHEVQKGSGVWGPELDQGDIFLIDAVHVNDRTWLRKGLGTMIVRKMMYLAEARAGAGNRMFSFATPDLCWDNFISFPGMSTAQIRQNILYELPGIAVDVNFFRSLGFRRVGRSAWLAHTSSHLHPSRQIATEGDCDCPFLPEKNMNSSWSQVFKSLEESIISDDDCLAQLGVAVASNPSTTTDPESQQVVINKEGHTILHAAIMSRRSVIIRHILAIMPYLRNVRTGYGETPLECLRFDLEQERSVSKRFNKYRDSSADFGGYSMEDVRCLCLLTDSQYCNLGMRLDKRFEDAVGATDAEDRRDTQLPIIRSTLRLTYGCTCNNCVEGFLSPRMRHCLDDRAIIIHHEIQGPGAIGAGDFKYNGTWGSEQLPAGNRTSRRQVPSHILADEPLREGFKEMFRQFARCVNQGLVPRKGNLKSFAAASQSASTGPYLRQDGAVDLVAHLVFNIAETNDKLAGPVGGADDVEPFDDKVYDALPVCRNDHEFGFVSAMCGYNFHES